PVVADRPFALLPGPSLLRRPACRTPARQHVRAAAPEPRPLHAAHQFTADAAHGAGGRALRPALARPLRRRERHRGRQAALCRRRRAPYLARARRRAAQAPDREFARYAGCADAQRRGRRSTRVLIPTLIESIRMSLSVRVIALLGFGEA